MDAITAPSLCATSHTHIMIEMRGRESQSTSGGGRPSQPGSATACHNWWQRTLGRHGPHTVPVPQPTRCTPRRFGGGCGQWRPPLPRSQWVWPGGLSPALALAEPYPPATARANTGAHRSPRSLTRCSSNVSARVCGDGERGNPHDDGGASPPRGLLCPTRLQHSPPPPQQSLHMLLSPLSSHAGCTAPATLPRETPHE